MVINDIIKYMYSYLNNDDIWKKINKKWIVVTNATSKIGMAFSRHLAKRGCNLIITGINEKALEELKKELDRTANVVYHKVDYSEETDYAFLKEYDIGLAINKIGFYNCKPMKFTENNMNTFMTLNVQIPLNFMKCMLEIFVKNDFGYIINIGFDYSEKPRPFFTLINSVKSMFRAMSKNLYYELKGSKVRVEYMECGSVSLKESGGSLFVPTASNLANSVFSMFGNSYFTVPYFPHFIEYLVLKFIPNFILARYRSHELLSFKKRIEGLF